MRLSDRINQVRVAVVFIVKVVYSYSGDAIFGHFFPRRRPRRSGLLFCGWPASCLFSLFLDRAWRKRLGTACLYPGINVLTFSAPWPNMGSRLKAFNDNFGIYLFFSTVKNAIRPARAGHRFSGTRQAGGKFRQAD
jgi:hypothetical protein